MTAAPGITCNNEFSSSIPYTPDSSNLFNKLFGRTGTKEENDSLNQIKGKIDEVESQHKDALLELERYRLFVIIFLFLLVVMFVVYFMVIVSQSSSNSTPSGGGRVRLGGGKK